MTTPVAKLCQSTTSTDGPTVLKNSPPGFYSSVVWGGGGTVTALGICGTDMGTASSQAWHEDMTPPTVKRAIELTGHALFHDRTGYTTNAFPIIILKRHQKTSIYTNFYCPEFRERKLAVNAFNCQISSLRMDSNKAHTPTNQHLLICLLPPCSSSILQQPQMYACTIIDPPSKKNK